MRTSRLEAFSDGVFAVAITLLVLDLHVPNPALPGSLARHLVEQWPNFAAYLVSFLTIGVIWINHHEMLRRLASADHSVLMLNVVLLMCIVVLPFTTSLMAEYLTASAGQHLAAVIYGGSFLLFRLVFLVMQRHLLINRAHLMHERPTPGLRRAILRRTAIGLIPYLLSTVSGLLSPYFTLAIGWLWGRNPSNAALTYTRLSTRRRWHTRPAPSVSERIRRRLRSTSPVRRTRWATYKLVGGAFIPSIGAVNPPLTIIANAPRSRAHRRPPRQLIHTARPKLRA